MARFALRHIGMVVVPNGPRDITDEDLATLKPLLDIHDEHKAEEYIGQIFTYNAGGAQERNAPERQENEAPPDRPGQDRWGYNDKPAILTCFDTRDERANRRLDQLLSETNNRVEFAEFNTLLRRAERETRSYFKYEQAKGYTCDWLLE
jgi:hypothetical protein